MLDICGDHGPDFLEYYFEYFPVPTVISHVPDGSSGHENTPFPKAFGAFEEQGCFERLHARIYGQTVRERITPCRIPVFGFIGLSGVWRGCGLPGRDTLLPNDLG